MPDRYGEPEPANLDAPDDVWAAQQRRALAIAHCELCDDDGYTPARRVCDHVDHRDAAVRGSAKVRAALAAKRLRSENRQRTELVAVRMLPAEKARLFEAARVAGVSASELVCQRLADVIGGGR